MSQILDDGQLPQPPDDNMPIKADKMRQPQAQRKDHPVNPFVNLNPDFAVATHYFDCLNSSNAGALPRACPEMFPACSGGL
jgi:hypothetical protein